MHRAAMFPTHKQAFIHLQVFKRLCMLLYGRETIPTLKTFGPFICILLQQVETASSLNELGITMNALCNDLGCQFTELAACYIFTSSRL